MFSIMWIAMAESEIHQNDDFLLAAWSTAIVSLMSWIYYLMDGVGML